MATDPRSDSTVNASADGVQVARIAKIDLDERTVGRRSAEVEHERAVAIFDLIEDNRFRLREPDHNGP